MSKLKVPKNRKKIRLTFDQFKELRNDLSLNQIIKTGVSKHQVAFFSALEQNKIGITRDQMQADYLLGRSLVEIATEYGIQKDFMVHLREHFGIPRLGPKFIHRKKTEKPLTYRQKKIIYGGLMGDAGRMTPASIKMKQSVKQEEYLRWKYSQLKEHVTERGVKSESSYHKVMGKTYESVVFYTHSNTEIEQIVSQFYSPHKRITQEILDNLDELSLAVWYMDDGTTDWTKKIPYPNNRRPESELCTDSFSLDECHLICKWFDERWDIKCHPRRHKRSGDDPVIKHRIIFPVAESLKLFDLISPYVIPSMLYKVDFIAYLRKRGLDVPGYLKDYENNGEL